MLNKFYKIIHNKYSRFFSFIFFLRYLFGIFFVSAALFLIIPYFFDYEKRVGIIKQELIKNYNLDINHYDEIKFRSLPTPRFEFKNAKISIKNSSLSIKVKKLNIFPKFLNIYNFENFQINKLVLKENSIIAKISDLKSFYKLLLQENKLTFKDLDFEIIDKNKPVINFMVTKFSNFGYKKNLIYGKIFGKTFKIKAQYDFRNLNFILLDSGVSADLKFNKPENNNLISGIFKFKILNSNFKFNFDYNDKKFKIYNSYFRSKNITFNNENIIILNPFLEINSIYNIEEINFQLFKDLDLNKLLNSKNFLKKINSKNEINYFPKKFNRNLVDEFNLKVDLAYGRMNYFKKFSISNNSFQCEGNLNLLEDYPLLFFKCLINISDKKKFLKEFNIRSNEKKIPVQLNIVGNLSILNKKISFKKILVNNDYNAADEDLKYFKKIFEKIMFDEGFLKIFSSKKIKNFILEIS